VLIYFHRIYISALLMLLFVKLNCLEHPAEKLWRKQQNHRPPNLYITKYNFWTSKLCKKI